MDKTIEQLEAEIKHLKALVKNWEQAYRFLLKDYTKAHNASH